MTQTIQFSAPSGLTGVTAKVFPLGSDTPTATVTATEATNRLGQFIATTTLAVADYEVIPFDDTGFPLGDWIVEITAASGNFICKDSAAVLGDVGGTVVGGVEATVDEEAIAQAVVSGIGSSQIEFVGPLSEAGTRMKIVTGDSYSVASGQSLTFSITNRPELIGYIPTIRLEGESTDFATAPAITSGTQSIVFNDVSQARTLAIENIGKLAYQVRFIDGDEEATPITGFATVVQGL